MINFIKWRNKRVLYKFTSCELNGTKIPIEPDKVVYTRDSEPPGIKVVRWRFVKVSPRKNEHKRSSYSNY